MLSPYSVQCTKTARSFHITHNTDNNHGRGLNNCDWLTSLLFVKLWGKKLMLLIFNRKSYIKISQSSRTKDFM
jgi:hypothetical protein